MVDDFNVALITNLLAGFFIAFWLFIWIGFIIAIILSRLWIRTDADKKPTSAFISSKQSIGAPVDPLLPEASYSGVSILKPLTGADEALSHNLESWFRLRYPMFELLFCVHNVDDAAVPVVNELISKYPEVDAKLVVSGAKLVTTPISEAAGKTYKVPLSPSPSISDGKQSQEQPSQPFPVADWSTIINPKIRNILPAYESSKYDLIFISDSNIEAEPETIHDVVSKMGPRVGTVCQMHFVKDAPPHAMSFGSIVNKVYFGTHNAKSILFLTFLRFTITVSAAMLIRKSALEECGGLRAFGCYLAEDLHIGLALTQKGWSHKLGSRLAWQNPANTSLNDIFQRLIRWKRLRQTTQPFLVLVDPLSECIVSGLAAACGLCHLFPVLPFLGIFLAHCLAWFFADYILLSLINRRPLKFPKFAFLLAWLVRELSAPLVHLASLLSRRVVWRGQQYYLRLGGKSERLPCDNLEFPSQKIKQQEALQWKKRATSLTLAQQHIPVVDLETIREKCTKGEIVEDSDLSCTQPHLDNKKAYTPAARPPATSAKPLPQAFPGIDDNSKNSRHNSTRRHQQQASSPPSLCAINA